MIATIIMISEKFYDIYDVKICKILLIFISINLHIN